MEFRCSGTYSTWSFLDWDQIIVVYRARFYYYYCRIWSLPWPKRQRYIFQMLKALCPAMALLIGVRDLGSRACEVGAYYYSNIITSHHTCWYQFTWLSLEKKNIIRIRKRDVNVNIAVVSSTFQLLIPCLLITIQQVWNTLG